MQDTLCTQKQVLCEFTNTVRRFLHGFSLALPTKEEVDQNLVLFRVARTQGAHLLRGVPGRSRVHRVEGSNPNRLKTTLNANVSRGTKVQIRTPLK